MVNWINLLKLLIPVMCFSNYCNVLGLDGSLDCKSRRQNSTLNLGASHPDWLLRSLRLSAWLAFFCLQLMKKMWGNAWSCTDWLYLVLVFMTCVQWLSLELLTFKTWGIKFHCVTWCWVLSFESCGLPFTGGVWCHCSYSLVCQSHTSVH